MVAATTLLNRPLSFADIADLPDDGMRHELIWGELYMAPAPSTKHQRVVRRIGIQIDAYLQQHGEGELFFGPFDVHLDEFNVVEPDIVVVGGIGTGILTDAGAQGAPALCIEVLSPGTRGMDLVKKHVLYSRFGVAEYWVVDPEKEQFTVYQLVDGKYIAMESADGIARSRALPGLEVDPVGISFPPSSEG